MGYETRSLRLAGHQGIDKPIIAPDVDHKVWLRQVSDAVAAAKKTGRKVVLVGHSMGGALSLITAYRSKPPVDGLVLLDPLIQNGGNWSEKFEADNSCRVIGFKTAQDTADFKSKLSTQLQKAFIPPIEFGRMNYESMYPPGVEAPPIPVSAACESAKIAAEVRKIINKNKVEELSGENWRVPLPPVFMVATDQPKNFVSYSANRKLSRNSVSPLKESLFYSADKEVSHGGIVSEKDNPHFDRLRKKLNSFDQTLKTRWMQTPTKPSPQKKGRH